MRNIHPIKLEFLAQVIYWSENLCYDNNTNTTTTTTTNNNEVFERPFSIKPKARTTDNQTNRRKVPDTKISNAAHTNIPLTSLSLQLHTHTHTHTHVHIHKRTCMHTHTHTLSLSRARAHTHIYFPDYSKQVRESLNQ